MNALEQYEKALANSKRNAMIMTGIGAAYNANLISSTKNAPAGERLPTPILKPAFLSSPGSEVVNIANSAKMARAGNANRDLIRSMGRPELAIRINDAEVTNMYDAMYKGLLTEYDTINKNQLSATETDNQNTAIAQEVRTLNMNAQKEENLRDSETISNAINQLYSMGTNLFGILGQSDALSLQARKMFMDENSEKAKSLAKID